MVTAVFGSINRAAPRPFRGRVKTKGVLGTAAATRTPFPFLPASLPRWCKNKTGTAAVIGSDCRQYQLSSAFGVENFRPFFRAV